MFQLHFHLSVLLSSFQFPIKTFQQTWHDFRAPNILEKPQKNLGDSKLVRPASQRWTHPAAGADNTFTFA